MKSSYRIAARSAVAAFCCATAFGACATAPEVREQALAEVAKVCVQASGLDAATPYGEPVEFDDVSGQTALVVQGVYPQPHMRGAHGAVLCLYDRRTGRASAAEWPAALPGASGPAGKP